MVTHLEIKRSLLRKLEQHARLSAEDREAILTLPSIARELEPSTYTVREGDPPNQCGILGSGVAYRQKLTGDGDRQIIGLCVPGDPLDFQHLFLDIADHSVQMMSRGEVLFIPRTDLQELVRTRAGVGHAVLVNILIESSIFREWVLNVGRRDARARMAHLFCEFAIRMEAQQMAEASGFHFPVNQEQLADALGLTPVHVNRTLKALEADGLISRDKRNIRFPSWERLRDVGDFNQRYLHRDLQLTGDPISAARPAGIRS
jgi:CRP-like cAMP-binding protein